MKPVLAVHLSLALLAGCGGAGDPAPAPAQRAPVATADGYAGEEDVALEVTAASGLLLNDSDPDGDPMTARLVAVPARGDLVLGLDGAFTYLPEPDFHGSVTFTYRAEDGLLTSTEASVTLTITPVPDAPVALADSYVADGRLELGASLGLLANDTDADGESLSAVLAAGPSHGTLTLANDGGFIYVPGAGFSGVDGFTYVADDGTLTSPPTEVLIEVAEPPQAPVASPDAYVVAEDGTLDVGAAEGLLANDLDGNGDPLTALLVDSVAAGSVTLSSDGSFRFVPAPDFHGPETFTYQASDGVLLSAETTVTITVTPVADPPSATNDAYEVTRDQVLTVGAAAGLLANDLDADGDALSAQSVGLPGHGTLSLSADGAFVYTPAAGYVGSDAFTYRASDGLAESSTATAAITVNAPTPRPPLAAADSFTTGQAQPLEIAAPGLLANDSDPDGDAISAVKGVAPAHGQLKSWSSTGAFRYVPDPAFVGEDSFTYRATDATGLVSAETTVTVTVADRNVAPIALGDALATTPGVPVTATLRGRDLDGDPLSFVLLTPPAHGTATLDAASGALVYSPSAGFEGGDELTYRVGDGALDSLPARVTIGVAASRGRWQAYGVPTPRAEHSATWTGSEVIVWGGHDIAGYHDTGARLDPSSGTWRRMARTGAPTGRADHTAVWTGTELIVWGGENDLIGIAVAGGGRYRPDTDTWLPISKVGAPAARTDHSAVWTGTEMIVCGGRNYLQLPGDGLRYDPVADAWKWISSTGSACNRYGHVAIWTGTEMIVWGGSLATGGRYDPVTNTWRPMSSAGAPTARIGFAWAWTGRELVVWGGEDPSTFADKADGGRYDAVTDTWSALPTEGAPSARANAMGEWTGSKVVVWGGDTTNVSRADGAAFDPATGVWSAVPVGGAPSARTRHSTTWTGSALVVFGGQTGGPGSERLPTGAALDPVAGSWTPTPVSGAPDPRYDHSAVWTGSRLLVWDGANDSPATNGGAYDPAAREWTALPTVGAPSARTQHCAVWTGDQMIVWGGKTAAVANSGGVLTPAAGTWRPVSTAGAPNVLGGTCIWTGRELVVWGGKDATATQVTPVGTGARYDPATDAWHPMSTANAPSPRYFHSAVWNGSEVIVWGGNGDSACPTGLCGTGAAYDPALDRWRPIAPAPSWPDGRASHLAVWADDRMLVWGGTANTGPLQSGYSYDPLRDAWAPLSTSGAPRARVPARGLWTGRELLVWGGADVSAPGNTGGLYDPATDSWRATSLVEAPPPLEGYGFAWTGQLLVFGGPGNEVWSYDP